MRDTARETRTDSLAIYSSVPLHINEQRLDDQLAYIYYSSVPIRDIACKTSREQWTIETGGKRGSERSVLAERLDDDIANNC